MQAEKLNLPNVNFAIEVEPGGIKKIKSEHRRSDAMSFVPLDKLTVIEGFNVRVRDESYRTHIRALADSMKVDGFKIDKPITCYVRRAADGSDEICVTDGHSRFEAAKLAVSEGASFDLVPVVFLSKAVNMADLTVDLIRANSGRPLTTYETAIVVKRLLNMEFTEDEIATKLSLTKTYIGGLLLLAAAPKPLANMVVAGRVAATTAIEALRKHGPAKATELLKAAAERAEASGKNKVTAAALPGASWKKVVRKSADRLYESATRIQQDPGYASLQDETRTLLDTVLAELRQAAQPA